MSTPRTAPISADQNGFIADGPAQLATRHPDRTQQTHLPGALVHGSASVLTMPSSAMTRASPSSPGDQASTWPSWLVLFGLASRPWCVAFRSGWSRRTVVERRLGRGGRDAVASRDQGQPVEGLADTTGRGRRCRRCSPCPAGASRRITPTTRTLLRPRLGECHGDGVAQRHRCAAATSRWTSTLLPPSAATEPDVMSRSTTLSSCAGSAAIRSCLAVRPPCAGRTAPRRPWRTRVARRGRR